jgi:cyclohexanecarboxylate-CoA ligase
VAAETVWQLVEDRAKQSPDAVMLLDEHGRTVTFGQFRDRALGLASALAETGIGPGSRVAWQLPTRMSTLLVLVALRRLGAVQAPLIPTYWEREVTAALATSEADTIIVPEAWSGNDYVLPDGLKVIVLGEDASGGALPEVPDDSDAVAWIFFTSGSTGAPKGARHAGFPAVLVETFSPVPAPQLADLTAWLRESGLMVQKLPERLHVVEMMPRTATGKFDKPALRAAYS